MDLAMANAHKTIFKRIIDGEIPADVVHEDEHCLAFRDVNPQAPTHVLIIPKQVIPSLDDASEVDEVLIGHLFAVAAKLARQFGLENGYRTVVNCGKDGGQTVDHLHVHLLGGRAMNWPPG
jgi:histidine triad (HIT) family protein